jgi:hypothetical protein
VVQSANRFAPKWEVFMIHTDETCEGLEWVELDDYDCHFFKRHTWKYCHKQGWVN